MRRIAVLVLSVLLIAVMLCACGEETYTCGWCMKEVTQRPHTVTVLGQEIKVCDSCYEMIEEYAIRVD